MVSLSEPLGLVGRGEETQGVMALIDRARAGLSGALVVSGPAGVGKSALIDVAQCSAPDLHQLRLTGVEAESRFAFAGLQRLLGVQLVGSRPLPSPQQQAIEVAFGLADGRAPDPFLVGLATVSLLAQLASERPVLVIIDDAHWLDRESLVSLSFAARRLDAEGVAVLFAFRPDEVDLTLIDGLEVLTVTDLDAEGTAELLNRIVGGLADPAVVRRVYEATAGNPLALTDLGAALSSSQLDGTHGLPQHLPVSRRLEAHYLRTIASLPPATQRWLTIAAAEPTGEVVAIERAAQQLGVAADSSAAERAGIITISEVVEFRHPLIRSVMYGSATIADRRAAHRALAIAIPPERDPDRHVGHLAAAAGEPDELVAFELETAATRAGLRGGFAARADLLTKAAALSPAPHDTVRRQLDAAAAAFTAGSFRRTLSQLSEIDATALSSRDSARFHLVDAEAVAVSGEPRAVAMISAKSIRAATLAGADHSDIARASVLLACTGGLYADRLMEGTTFDEVARVSRSVAETADSADMVLVRAFASLVLDGYEAAVPLVRAAMAALLDPATPDELVMRHCLLGVTVCSTICDDVARWAIHERALRVARETGALGILNSLLFSASMSLTLWGRLDDAEALLVEGVQLQTVLSRSARQFSIYRHSELAAWQGGDRDELEAVFDMTIEAGRSMGHGATVVTTEYARVILGLSCGDYQAATGVAVDLIEHDPFNVQTRVLPLLVEAAARSGRLDLAEDACRLLEQRATAAATPYLLALFERSRALVAADSVAEQYYLSAIDQFSGSPAISDLARTHLVYGEWLRRRRRGTDARTHLQQAHSMFIDMGASGFADRARRELVASGGRARRRTAVTSDELTGQERQIALLVAEGFTNAEIAARLYISAPTVDYHLRKVFRKLQVTSRRQLRGRTF